MLVSDFSKPVGKRNIGIVDSTGTNAIYAAGRPLDTPDARWAATQGWAFAPLSIDAVLQRIEQAESAYALALSDGGENARSGPFYASSDFASVQLEPLRAERRLRIHGRDWIVHFCPPPGWSPWRPQDWAY